VKVQRLSSSLNGPSMYSARIFRLARSSANAARECLADQLVGDRHIGDERHGPVRIVGAPADAQRLDQRQEFRDSARLSATRSKHLGRRVLDAARRAEAAQSPQTLAARAAFSRAKSSPA